MPTKKSPDAKADPVTPRTERGRYAEPERDAVRGMGDMGPRSWAHEGLTVEHWRSLSLVEQLGNVGSEVGRAITASRSGNHDRFIGALDRALDLFDLTLADDRWAGPRRREIARAREVTCDFLVGDNDYGSTAESLDAWFLTFALAARRGR